MAQFCYFNGVIIPLAKAVLPVTDISILRGYAIFDFTKTYNGRPFLLREHCARLRRTAKKMNLEVPITDQDIENVIHDLLKKNKMKDANVRIVVTGGPTIDGLSYNPQNGNFFILVEEIKNVPRDVYAKGAKLITHEHARPFAESKTTNYITAVSLQDKKKKAGALEILFTSAGKVLEATTSNFFMVKGNQIITPKDDILIGITRNYVIELARTAGLKVVERAIKTSELKSADEAFITASNKEIVPIVKIDAQKIGKGKVGSVTQLLMNNFKHAIQSF